MNAGRLVFWLATALAAMSVWLAPHPPMIDMPQHAGQLALLQQFVRGDTQWTALFQINLFTPYLIGFALALPLSFVMPIAAALKVMLMLAFTGFVAVCVALRKHFGGDARLDWVYLCPFFGYAFHWGFFTFLTAAPLGLLLVLLADRYAMQPSLRRGLWLALTGVVLLPSHGLVFLYALGTASALLLVRVGSLRKALLLCWPLAVMAAACVAYYFARGPAEAAFGVTRSVPAVMWQLGLRHEVLSYMFDMEFRPWMSAAGLAMLAAPWLMGLRIKLRQPAALVPFALTALLLTFVPSFMFETAFVYQRFALFLLPAYVWMFGVAAPAQSSTAPRAAASALALLCTGVMAFTAWTFWQFGRESADFDRVAAQAAPRQRALALVYDRESTAMGRAPIYVHHASWYQAEQQGLVDFNFAWVQPQVVRYRVATRPPVALDFPWHPLNFDWQRNGGDTYRYFFVRGTPPADVFKGSPCPPQLLKQDGAWRLYERAICPATGGVQPGLR